MLIWAGTLTPEGKLSWRRSPGKIGGLTWKQWKKDGAQENSKFSDVIQAVVDRPTQERVESHKKTYLPPYKSLLFLKKNYFDMSISAYPNLVVDGQVVGSFYNGQFFGSNSLETLVPIFVGWNSGINNGV